MKVICYANRNAGRSSTIARAMVQGFRKHGHAAEMHLRYEGIKGDLAVGYGWNLKRVFAKYKDRARGFLYVDLGFWDRKPAHNPRGGYHKVCVSSWCPVDTMLKGCPPNRWRALGRELQAPPTDGESIIVAGMSSKSAAHHELYAEQWERAAIGALREHTDAPIIYRPKPSWDGATNITGALLDYDEPLPEVLRTARALVTHHSNAAVDAVLAGVPHYCERGVGSVLSVKRLTDVLHAQPQPEAVRAQFLYDVAYLQWTPAEMASGLMWDYYKGLL